MNILFYIILFIFWTMFWSFTSVIIYRLKSWEKWIFNGRSHCSSCNRILKAIELIPIVSWIINKWKCKVCKKKISKIYPLLEISTWLLFAWVWYFLIDINLILSLNIIEIIKLLFFLSIAFITIIYIFYDILFLEIPDTILIIWIIITFIILSLQSLFKDFNIINNLPINNQIYENYIIILAIILSFIIISWLYIIMFKELNEKIDIIILLWSIWLLYLFKTLFKINITDIAIINWVIWAISIFIFFFLQIVISKGKWMWWWDLRIAILVWLIMGTALSFQWMFITYILWSVIWLSIIVYQKLLTKKQDMTINSQIPFWPFIWIGFFIVIFMQDIILKYSEIYL